MQEKHTSLFKSFILFSRNVILCALVGAVFALIADESAAYSVSVGFFIGFLISLPPKFIHFLMHHWKPVLVLALIVLGQGGLAFIVAACLTAWSAFGGMVKAIALLVLIAIIGSIALKIFS